MNFVFQILKLRAVTEGIAIEEEALAALAEVGANSTLRYKFYIFIKFTFEIILIVFPLLFFVYGLPK